MPKKIVFDFDSVTFMDSAGIGLIIGRYKFCKYDWSKNLYEKSYWKCKKNF